jgi:competence protein ComEC
VPAGLPGPAGAVLAYAALAAVCSVRLGERGRRWLVDAGLARRAPWTVEARAAGIPARVRPRWGMVAPAGLVAGATVLLLAPGPPRPPDGPTLSLLDVGQGDAVLLQDGPRAALFDTGRPGAPLVDELRASGVERLDLVVITHSSSDHEGGLTALLAAMPVGFVLDGRGPGREAGGEGGGARFEGLPATLPRGIPEQGQRFSVGRVAVEILWPPPGEPRRGDPNLTAAVAVARTRTTSALLTADAESQVTLPLDPPDVDVLKVAHHGSDDPGLAQLLAATTPRTALIPVGRNTYGHPTPATLATLREAVPDVRRTDRGGTIRVPLGP